jgi:K+/H+ antiporter YhaU regulatory subunit KhtT
MNDVEMWIEVLQTVGVPSVVCAASFYYIFKKDIWAQKERQQFMQRDEDADARVFSMLEKQNENANKLSLVLEGLSQSHEHLSDKIAMMVDVFKNHERDRKR